MKLDDEIEAWAEAEWPDASIGAKFRKLGEEVGELGEALMILLENSDPNEDPDLFRAARSEAADCGICLSHIIKMLGGDGIVEEMGPVFEKRRNRDERGEG